jgi:hypothetical protein
MMDGDMNGNLKYVRETDARGEWFGRGDIGLDLPLKLTVSCVRHGRDAIRQWTDPVHLAKR